MKTRWTVFVALILFSLIGESAFANTAPSALPDRVVVRGVHYVLIDVLANDSDPDGDPLNVTVISGGQGITHLGDGLLQFQPTACLDTAQVVTYQVDDGAGSGNSTTTTTLTLAAGGCGGNLEPLAQPDIGDTSPGTMAYLYVLDNDTDPDGDPLCIDRVFDLHHGTATITPDCQRVDFMPSPGYQGGDASFRYAVQDGRGGEDEAIARVSVFGGMPGDPLVPDQFFTEENKILVLAATDLLANDDPGVTFEDAFSEIGDSVDVVWAPSGETYILYQPPAGWIGSREFLYQATDSAAANGNTQTFEATVTVHMGTPVGSMRAQDDAQHTVTNGCMTVDLDHLLSNDLASGEMSLPTIVSPPQAGTLQSIAGSGGKRFTYQPAPGYQGKDFFTYAVTDTTSDGGGSTDVATVVLDVRDPGAPGAVAPVALTDFASVNNTQTGAYVLINVLENDYHPQCGGSLQVIATAPEQGTASIQSNGTIRFTPGTGVFGEIVVEYTILGTQGLTSQGLARVDVQGQNSPPHPRFFYRDCSEISTCIVDGQDSRRGDFSIFNWDNCAQYWHYEGVNAPPPESAPCHPLDAPEREPVQLLGPRYPQGGLHRVDLKLWSLGLNATAGRWVPVGGTTTEWTIGHECIGSTCNFWPEGNWVEGAIERFEWHFDGVHQQPDMTSFNTDPVIHTYTGAAPGQSFQITLYFHVFDLPNPLSEQMWVSMPIPLPAPPSGLLADNSSCKSTAPLVSWTDNASTEDGYTLYRGINGGPLVQIAELDANETQIQDFYAGPRDDVLTYRVAAFNDGGEALGNFLDSRPTPSDCGGGQQAPVAPTQLAADPPANGVRLYWRDNSALEAGHRVYRRPAGGSFQLIASIGSGAETYFDAPLAANTSYTYRVTAFNAFGESAPTGNVVVAVPDFVFADSFESGDLSAWSLSVGNLASPPVSSRTASSRTTPPEVLAGGLDGQLENEARRAEQNFLRPSDLRVADLRRSGVELAWQDNADSELGFELRRKQKGEAWATIATLPPNATSLFDGPLQAGKKYRYRIVAFDDRDKRKKSSILRVELPKALFADSFETARLSSWTSITDSGSQLSVAPATALFGNFGLRVDLGEAAAYLVDDTPAEERRYRARFLLDPRQVSAGSTSEGQRITTVLEARSPENQELFSLNLLRSGSGLAFAARLRAADGSTLTSPPTDPLDTRVQSVEVDWQAERADGSARLRLWLNGKKVALLEGWEAGDLAVSEIRFGSLTSNTAAGFLGLDEFLSRRGGGRLRQKEFAGDLFQETFEFEDLLDWEEHSKNGATAGVVSASLEGEKALEVALSGQRQKAYLERRLRYPERHLLASFLVDPQNLTVSTGSKVQILSGLSRESGEVLVGLYLKQTGDGLEIRAQARDGSGNSAKQLLLPNGPARIEVEWRAATSPTATDGSLVLRVTDEVADDSSRRVLESLATGGEHLGTLRVGTAKNTPAGVSGSYLLDDLETWR